MGRGMLRRRGTPPGEDDIIHRAQQSAGATLLDAANPLPAGKVTPAPAPPPFPPTPCPRGPAAPPARWLPPLNPPPSSRTRWPRRRWGEHEQYTCHTMSSFGDA